MPKTIKSNTNTEKKLSVAKPRNGGAKKVVKAPVVKKAEVKPVETKKVEIKKVVYRNKNMMISPRKLRLVADIVRKLKPNEAINRLKLTNSKAARLLVKSIKNVIADAKNNFGLNTDTLTFDSLRVDEGMKIKRMDKAHGSRFVRGLKMKRHSRIEIIVKGETQ